jgi:hypothetical protein
MGIEVCGTLDTIPLFSQGGDGEPAYFFGPKVVTMIHVVKAITSTSVKSKHKGIFQMSEKRSEIHIQTVFQKGFDVAWIIGNIVDGSPT